jgi:hypothetical protein
MKGGLPNTIAVIVAIFRILILCILSFSLAIRRKNYHYNNYDSIGADFINLVRYYCAFQARISSPKCSKPIFSYVMLSLLSQDPRPFDI